jgi:EpsD family peptidyl-prolyl cis-trans isomerase
MCKGKNLCFLFIMVSILLVISCKKEKGTSGKIIAKVENKSLTIEDFLKQVPAQILIRTTAENRKLLLETWVANEIVYKDAMKNDFLKKPEVKEKIEQFKRQLLTTAYMQEILSKVQFVSELEARSYFESHKDDYNSRVEVSHISSDSKQGAEEIRAKLKKGESFAKLAEEYSTDSETAENKGYLGSFRRGEFAAYPLFEEAVFKLKKPGEISDVVETEFGFDIIKLHSRKKSPVSYENVSQSVIMEIRTQKFQKRSRAVIDSLKEIYSNEIFPEVLEQEMGIPSVLPGLPASLER